MIQGILQYQQRFDQNQKQDYSDHDCEDLIRSLPEPGTNVCVGSLCVFRLCGIFKSCSLGGDHLWIRIRSFGRWYNLRCGRKTVRGSNGRCGNFRVNRGKIVFFFSGNSSADNRFCCNRFRCGNRFRRGLCRRRSGFRENILLNRLFRNRWLYRSRSVYRCGWRLRNRRCFWDLRNCRSGWFLRKGGRRVSAPCSRCPPKWTGRKT